MPSSLFSLPTWIALVCSHFDGPRVVGLLTRRLAPKRKKVEVLRPLQGYCNWPSITTVPLHRTNAITNSVQSKEKKEIDSPS